MRKRYIAGYVIVAVALFGGILWLFPKMNQDGKLLNFSTEQKSTTIDPSTVTLPPDAYGEAEQPQQGPQNITNPQQQNIMNAILHTNKGDITIEFFGDKTPITVNNFVELARAGFYDGVKFHRVIKDFMIQGGDPLSKDDSMVARWGTGGPGYSFKDEIRPDNRNSAGTIAMANAGPNTNGSQFFINLKDNNFLDTKHTVFGRVTQGAAVVQSIGSLPVNGSDQPLEPIIIKSITLH